MLTIHVADCNAVVYSDVRVMRRDRNGLAKSRFLIPGVAIAFVCAAVVPCASGMATEDASDGSDAGRALGHASDRPGAAL